MALEPGKAVVGFIGTGVMGRHAALHLLEAGYRLLVHSRTRERAQPVLDAGGEWRDDPADVARESDVVFTMLRTPQDVAEAYAGPGGVLESARPGTYLVDMTTSSPALARTIAEAGAQRGVRVLDAPVTGGENGARQRRLWIVVGGEPDDFEAVRPLLELLGKSVMLHGPAGAGQHAKAANQIAVASALVGVSEALAYAVNAGLDPSRMLESLAAGSGASWALSSYGPRMLSGDLESSFTVEHFLKDLEIALESAEQLDVDLPGVELARMLYREVAEMGYGEKGRQSLFEIWRDDDGDTPEPLVQLTRR